MAAVGQPSQHASAIHSLTQPTPVADSAPVKGHAVHVEEIGPGPADYARRASVISMQDPSTKSSATKCQTAGDARMPQRVGPTSAPEMSREPSTATQPRPDEIQANVPDVKHEPIATAQAHVDHPPAKVDSAPAPAAPKDTESSSEKKGDPLPVVFDINAKDAATEVEGSDQPSRADPSYGKAIQWVVLAYNSLKEVSLDTYSHPAVASYQSWRPIKQTKPLYRRPDAEIEDAEPATTDGAKWSGPVFLIRQRVQAYMPWLKCDYPELSTVAIGGCLCTECAKSRENSKKRATIYNRDELPDTFEKHRIERWAQPALVIKSPHLYQELFDIVEHYPGAISTLYNKSVQASWEFEIATPLDLLLHHHAEIEKRVSGETTAAPNDKASTTEQQVTEEAAANLTDEASETKPAADDPEGVFQQDPVLAKEHLKYLHQYLKDTRLQQVTECQATLKGAKPKIAWDMLWYVLHPGQLVYVKDQWTPWYLARVDKLVRVALGGSHAWAIGIWVMSSDGAKLARYQPPALILEQYDGLKEVTSLDICPVDIWDRQHDSSRQLEALARGKLLLKAIREGHLLAEYAANDGSEELGQAGQVVVDHRRGQDMTGIRLRSIGLAPVEKDKYSKYDSIYVHKPWTRGQQHAQIYTQTPGTRVSQHAQMAANARQVGHDRSGNDTKADPYGQSPYPAAATSQRLSRKAMPLTAADATDPLLYLQDPASDSNPDREVSLEVEDDIVKLLYPLTFGFSLKAKIWLELDATRLQEIKYTPDPQAFLKGVVLPEGTEKVFRAITRRLSSPELAWSADFVKGKGSGEIVLLHGPPGTGKTFTVERIAQELNRPLLALTVADLGSQETEIEAELLKWFAYAEVWKAIMLIDEADIFIEQRRARDLRRNGLVSAFLRRADYFDGSLFLTTNRVGQIDDAFISRIQFAIHYPALESAQQKKIWENFFAKLSKEQRALRASSQEGSQSRQPRITIEPDAKAWVLKAFAGEKYKEMNGRDIRNALQTAITLAVCNEEDEPGSINVEAENFQQVLDMGVDFRKEIANVAQAPEDVRAFQRHDRALKGRLTAKERQKIISWGSE